jgi:low temperature requirement protein LtrA
VRQYFHKGLLWRASSKEEVGSFELFVDLLYVGIIGVVGDVAAEHATGDAFLKFSIIFIIGWKIWSDLTLIVSWFETGTLEVGSDYVTPEY